MTRQAGPYYDEDYLRQGSPTNSLFAETLPRIHSTSAAVALAATGVELAVAIPLQFGDVVSNVTFVVGATAAVTPTAGYAVLRDPAGAKLVQTADFGSTARGANTAYTVALTAPYTVTVPGLYRVGLSFTAGTVPSVEGVTLGHAAVAGAIGLSAPILAQTHGSAVGATAPATIATPTTVAAFPYLVLT
jgi:hypothetical protein